jgi:hypothetical protein
MNFILVFTFFVSAYFLDMTSAILVWAYNKEHFEKNEQNLEIKYLLKDGLNIQGLIKHSINGMVIALLLVLSVSLFHMILNGSNQSLFNEVIFGIGTLNMIGFGTNVYALIKARRYVFGHLNEGDKNGK